MTEKTAQQINRMKEQTIGVEIEMNNITRKAAAKLAAEFFGTDRTEYAGKLKSYIQLCLAMSQMAKDLRSASPKEQQKENKKFAMRTWLMRMGFIGSEFETARETLTENLSGDNAFRFGRP